MTEITRAQVDIHEANLRAIRKLSRKPEYDLAQLASLSADELFAYISQLEARVGVLEAQAKDEIAWLVEIKNPIAPTWLARTLTDEGLLEWTTDHQKAIRFCRKEDAEAYISEAGWLDAFASEHMWMAPRPKAALAGKAAP